MGIVLNGGTSLGNNLTYQWRKNGGSVFSTLNSITVTAVGSYELTVSDGVNSSTDTVVITSNFNTPNVDITSNTTEITQTGQIITLTATSGLLYHWSTGANTQSINVNSAGNYSVTGTSKTNGCIGVDNINITENISDLTLSYNSANGLDLTCEFPTLLITTTVSGAVGALSYEWRKQPSNLLVSIGTPVPLNSAGTYQITVSDAGNGNTDSVSLTLTGTPTDNPPTAVVTGPTALSCVGTTTMDASNSTGDGTLRYEWWDMDLIELIGTGTTKNITSAGTYKLYVYNGTSACNDSVEFTISEASFPSITLYSTAQIVYSGTPVTLSASIVGGVGPYTYNWYESYGATIVGGSPQSTTTVQASTGGLYYLAVTGANGCTTTKSIGLTNGTLADTQAPTPPTNFNAYDGQYYPQISTSWVNGTDNVGITYIDIFRTVSGYPYGTTPIGSVTYPNTVWVDTTTSPSVEFCYKARSRDAAGNVSIFSNEDCHTRFPLTIIVASKAGDGSITNPLSYNGYSICDGQSGPFTYTFNKASGASVASGMQLYTIGGQVAIPGNMGSYNTNYNTLGVKWALINGTVWQVDTSTGKLSSGYSQC